MKEIAMGIVAIDLHLEAKHMQQYMCLHLWILVLVSAEKAEESHVTGNFKNIPDLSGARSLALKVRYPSFGESMICWSIPETLKTLGVCTQVNVRRLVRANLRRPARFKQFNFSLERTIS